MRDFAKPEEQPKKRENPFITLLLANMYPGITLFARDVNLQPGLAEKYKAGMIIREKGFTDATIRFGGMATSPPLRDPLQPHGEFCRAGGGDRLGAPCGE